MNVYVGLSGGVDSAVSAALLKEQGHHVVGCFIKIWQPEFTECTWREDRLDAMRVCATLHIPYKEIDLSREYLDEVVRDMIDGYKNGVTPNPDVLCNRAIKFGFFSRWAYAEGADLVATGHYARIKRVDDGYVLVRGVDTNKDQSYFLWQLTQQDLSRALFPVGSMTKPEVRKEAERRKLPVSKKHDSQGLCFVGDISLPEFLSRYISLTPGPVTNEVGEVLGTHAGAALYTIGQRHGFEHSSQVPQYVIRIDIASNTLVVSQSRDRALSSRLLVSNDNWITRKPSAAFSSSAQVRYREDACFVETTPAHDRWTVHFQTPHIASPGQSIVWYDGDTVLGGGIISATTVEK